MRPRLRLTDRSYVILLFLFVVVAGLLEDPRLLS